MLTDAQIDRYSRQILLPEIGGRGQERLLAGRVAVIGEGRLAALLQDYLLRAGIGHVGATLPLAADPNASNPDCGLEAIVTPPTAGRLAGCGACGRKSRARGVVRGRRRGQ